MAQAPSPPYLTYAEGSMYLRSTGRIPFCSVRTLKRAKLDGEIDFVVIGGNRVFFTREQLDAYVDRMVQTVKATA